MSISKLLFTGILLSTLGLSGCSNMSHQDKTTAGGAVIGGAAGHLLCGGVLCTGVGAAVGGVIGHEVGKDDKKKK
ncbi:lipoprotein [Pseudomonas sp. 8BK]|jgi:osmotically inducible lipoprotein OsmB|uniref:osmotically-inducible lipoprotein B n=1 Tax=Pseudomonas sp. 8BK TaxID=2653164 RepID=UPI0012EF2F3E|nr:osmotically-inducible lipoprotein B [Pseudomonas sp. 8BK]VXB24456.1 lipoprotein [Pseudomonas sp. 8BK]